MKKTLAFAALILLYVLHQDFWLWDNGTLVFGFLPAGLLYHAGYCVLASLLLAFLIRHAWPANLPAGQSEEDTGK